MKLSSTETISKEEIDSYFRYPTKNELDEQICNSNISK